MLNNVKFSVSVPTYSTTHKRMVMGDSPTYEHVLGRFSEMQTTLESEIVRGADGDRVVRYRLIFQRTRELEDAIKSGAVIMVTHKLHPWSNAWIEQSSPEQYLVDSDHEVQATGFEINLGLKRKDQA